MLHVSDPEPWFESHLSMTDLQQVRLNSAWDLNSNSMLVSNFQGQVSWRRYSHKRLYKTSKSELKRWCPDHSGLWSLDQNQTSEWGRLPAPGTEMVHRQIPPFFPFLFLSICPADQALIPVPPHPVTEKLICLDTIKSLTHADPQLHVVLWLTDPAPGFGFSFLSFFLMVKSPASTLSDQPPWPRDLDHASLEMHQMLLKPWCFHKCYFFLFFSRLLWCRHNQAVWGNILFSAFVDEARGGESHQIWRISCCWFVLHYMNNLSNCLLLMQRRSRGWRFCVDLHRVGVWNWR